ncbi:hypothetical protein JZ751_008702 [Albula glossodonta]|uniref:Fibroblast growth factor n=1 Tax=Albula glossodonta TaxID=121402 RepID=A0A8T2P7P3_9TELE|nr:hypothetical protein JZ751_008702 [Albula glossodonta]
MATGDITTLPSPPEDGSSVTFPPGNFKDPKRLYCKNGGYFLRITTDGRVDGIRDKNDPQIRLQLQATSVGEVVIKGVSSNRYLAMNKDGRLFGVRLESNNYNTYRSRKFPDWYVALKRNGQHKPGSKTSLGQKAILFLPMSARS